MPKIVPGAPTPPSRVSVQGTSTTTPTNTTTAAAISVETTPITAPNAEHFAGVTTTSEAELKPTPALAGSKRLLDLMLAGDKTSHIERLDPKARGTDEDRSFAKHVARLLMTTPHAAPLALIMKTLQADPQVKARYPKLTREDLEALHTRFPELVPLPSLPVDFGNQRFPTVDGYIDLLLSKYMLPRADFVAQSTGVGVAAGAYWQSRFQGARGEQDFPDLNTWFSQLRTNVGALQEDAGRTGLFLRRVIMNAPPTWGPQEISDEFNRSLDFIGAVVTNGVQDTLAAATERARMTPERVRAIMGKHAFQSGANALAERQALLRTTVESVFSAAAPTDNLYTLLQRICDTMEQASTPARPDRGPNDVWTRLQRLPPPPSPNATLTPDDIAGYLAHDAGGAALLEKMTSARRETLDKSLATGIVEKLGPRLGRTSLSEIVRVMKADDPVYNEDLVRHLFASFPELFPVERVETARVEANFLLANQVADAMDRIFEGATLADVAALLKKTNPTFAETLPDFGVDDVKLLQQAYPFLPRWDVKPKGGPGASAGEKLSLESLLTFAAKQLGVTDKATLRAVVLESLDEGLRTGKVPPKLEQKLRERYTTALVGLVVELTGVRPPMGMAAAPLRALIAGTEQPAHLDEEGMRRMLMDKQDGCALPADQAARIARAFQLARDLDFAGLEEHFDQLAPASSKSEVAKLKLANVALGYDGLLSRIERDVFKDHALKASYERFSRIPLRLPMIQQVVDKYKDQQPLKDTNVLMVQHMLGQAYPQIAGYKQLGMNTEDAIFVGIPYHKNEEVEQAVARSFGIDVRVPAKDMEALYRSIEGAVDDLVKKHKENHKPCLIVCDGPYAREYFMKKYPELAGSVRFTEQTAFGDRPEQRANKSIRVVSYARTHLKGREAEFVGQSVSRAVSRVMQQLKTGYEHKPVLILGMGSIGLATASAFQGDGAKVYIFDPNPTPEATALATEKGWTILKDKSEIAKGKFLMVGCSGHTSIDEEQILASDDNAVYVSASSKLVEINMRKLAELATDDEGRVRKVLAAEVNDQQTWHYWLKDGTIRTVIADGLPANFNDVNVVAPEFIDMTMALSLAAAVDAMSSAELGYFDLNAEDHKALDDHFNGFLEHLDARAQAGAAGG